MSFNVCQTRAEGKDLCYHSYVTECGEGGGGSVSLIGVSNTCSVECSPSLLGDAQSMQVKRSPPKALKRARFIYLFG